MTRHEKSCGVCGSFLPLLRSDDAVIVCPKCGTEWEVPATVRREDALMSLAQRVNEGLSDA